MKISVVIPTYQRPDLLLLCLDSLNAQLLSTEDFEVIVVSDGFDEATQLLVFNYAERNILHVSYRHTEGKKGPAAARNIGWRHASAPLIAFTDDDCQPQPAWLSAFLTHYHGEKFKVFSGVTKVPLPADLTDFALNTSHLQTADFITANCACSQAALQETGGFDERFQSAWREDSDLAFRFEQRRFPVIKVRNAIVIHPVRSPAGWGVSIREQKKNLYNALLYKKHPSLYQERIQARPPLHYYGIVLLAALWVAFVLAGRPYAAIASLILLFALVFLFFLKRIRSLPKTGANITEMLVTSFVIPFVAVYWRLYGAAKFRVLFF